MASVITFLDLPNELKLQVLSDLPAKEIARTRRVCKHFRDLVDTTENTTVLLGPGRVLSKQRLQLSISRNWDYRNISFFAAFRLFYMNRGVWPGHRDIETALLYTFADLWMAQHAEDYKHLSAHANTVLLGDFIYAGYVLLTAHSLGSKLLEEQPYCSWLDVALENVKRWPKEVGITLEVMRDWTKDIVKTPLNARGDAFQNKPIGPVTEVDAPKWPLTSLKLQHFMPGAGSDDEDKSWLPGLAGGERN